MDDNLGTEIFSGSEISSFTGAGWVYTNAHLSDLTLSVLTSAETVTGSINLLTDNEMRLSASGSAPSLSWGGTSLPEPLYFLVPAIVLAGAGYAFVKQTPVHPAQTTTKHGAAVVAGYLPIVVLSTIIFTETRSISAIEQSMTLEPNLLTALLLAGFLWPLLFGAIGGYLWFRFNGTAPVNSTRRRPSRVR